MILLLDAHAVLWALTDDSTLLATARSAVADPANEVAVSVASIWELEIKRAQGRLRPPEDLLTAIEEVRMAIVPIIGLDAIRAAELPLHHRDPFDRMLIAQSVRLGATIVTRDAAFDAYGVDRLAA